MHRKPSTQPEGTGEENVLVIEHDDLSDGDAATACYAELAEVIDRWLPLIPRGAERDQLVRSLRHLQAAASLPPLRLLD